MLWLLWDCGLLKKRAAGRGSSLEECMKFIKVGCSYFLSIFLPLTM